MKRLTLLALAVTGLFLTAGAKKTDAVALRIYPEAGPEGGQFSKPIELMHNKRQTTMATMPLLNENDIISYHPFPAVDGSGTYGAYFRVDAHGKNLLSQHTMARRSTFLLVFLNGRRVIDLYIDRPVQDNILAISSGFTAAESEMLKYKFPAFGDEGKDPPKPPKEPKKPKEEKTKDA